MGIGFWVLVENILFGSLKTKLPVVLKLLVLLNMYVTKYTFVETPRKFTIAKLSIRKLGSSSVLDPSFHKIIF